MIARAKWPSSMMGLLGAALALAACKKTRVNEAPDGAPVAPASAKFVPAPNSPLARALGADDAGRGKYRFFDDGPWCGNAPSVDRRKPLHALREPARDAASDAVWSDFFETERAPEQARREDAPETVHLLLKGPSRVRIGEEAHLSLTLVNGGKTPFTFSIALDGSFEHWRSPFVDLYAQRNGRTYRFTFGTEYGRCGNVNARVPESFVTLPSGQRLDDPFGDYARHLRIASFSAPGRYTVWVVYAACTGAEYGAGRELDVAAPSGAFEGTLTSNELSIDVIL